MTTTTEETTTETASTEEAVAKGPQFTRHAAWFSQDMVNGAIIIVGCGAVGSNVAMIAARMGFNNFILFDNDDVEPHNLPNQAFYARHIGMPKVEALAELLQEFDPSITVEAHNEFFTEDTELSSGGALVIATDSMKSRGMLGEFFDMNPDISGVFDTRLGFDYGQVNLVDPFNADLVELYKGSIVDDKDVPEGPCNQKICGTLVLHVSSFVVHMLCDHVRSLASGDPWDLEKRKRTFFQLDEKLTTVQL